MCFGFKSFNQNFDIHVKHRLSSPMTGPLSLKNLKVLFFTTEVKGKEQPSPIITMHSQHGDGVTKKHLTKEVPPQM